MARDKTGMNARTAALADVLAAEDAAVNRARADVLAAQTLLTVMLLLLGVVLVLAAAL